MSKLTAYDLMIDDWIQVLPSGIRKMKITQLREDYWEMDDIEPVPLTPEILDGNFSSNPHWWFLGCTDVKLRISKDDSSYTLFIAKKGVDVSLKIKYVHELQHALKLCRIDKEIIL